MSPVEALRWSFGRRSQAGFHKSQARSFSMFRFRCRVFLPSALLACCLAGPLSAQSGPSGADRTSRPPTGSSVVQTITPQSMATVLKTLDLSVTDVKNVAFDLIEYRVVSKKDGWTYHVDVRVDGRAKLIWLVSPLGEPVKEDQVGSAKLLKLLSMNNVVRPFFFSYRETDRRMCLNFEFANNASTEQFRTGFNLFLDMIRATRPEWDLAQGENGQQGAPPLQVSGKVLEVGKGLKVNGELSKHTKNVTYLVKLEKDKT